MSDVILFCMLITLVALTVLLSRKKATFLGAYQKFNPKDDVTTVLPVPMRAATCAHDWEKLTDQVLESSAEKRYILVMACRLCGAVDKTVQVVHVPPPPQPFRPPPPRSECHHRWVKEKTVTLGSAYEQLKQKFEGELPPWMFQKRYISIRTCSLCGEIDKTIAANFDETTEES